MGGTSGRLVFRTELVEEKKMYNFSGFNFTLSPNPKSGIAPSGSPGLADTLLASGT